MGFFTKEQTASLGTVSNKRTYTCVTCGLFKSVLSPRMNPYGNFKRRVMVIGEAPEQVDDERHKPFQGKAGRLLQRTLRGLGLNLMEDCVVINAINCFPKDAEGEGRPPTGNEIDCCRRIVMRAIREYKPHVIIPLGISAISAIIQHRWHKDFGSIRKWRGWTIPDRDLHAWVCPTFHPTYIVRSDVDAVERVIWEQDLTRAIDCIDKPLPEYREPVIEIIEDLSPLDEIETPCSVAIDWEATGIKPHDKGHRIICAAVATSPDHAYAFMIPKTKRERAPLTRLLTNLAIRKRAHNMKYEDVWALERLLAVVQNWEWDSMIYAHVEDNRRNITNLKFQSFVKFGVVDYASEITPFLESTHEAKKAKGANAINRIEELLRTLGGGVKLLRYCGLDAVYEYRLSDSQMINIKNPAPYQLLHDGVLALTRAEQQGIRLDMDYIAQERQRLDALITQLEVNLRESSFYRRWEHSMGGKKVNIHSNPQLAKYLYGVRKIEPPYRTESNQGATDEDALMQLGIPELETIIRIRKYKKLRDTYLAQFEREQVNGIIHPSFNLHLVITYRSSSNNPNFQNIPKRDKESMQTIRRAMFPRVGHQLLEIDYSSLEVRIAACYHQDPTMLEYLKTGHDMHRDMTREIFKLDEFDKKVPSHAFLRSAAKNGFVFPQFYGDYYGNNARDLSVKWGNLPKGRWRRGQGIALEHADGEFLADHMIANGIKSLDDFTAHLKEIEDDFWGKRFPVYAEWKEQWYDDYRRRGYIEMKTGFQCRGEMSKNDCINYPVQGAAFHCLLWSFNRMDNIMLTERWDTRLVGQIHDAIILDTAPAELSRVKHVARRVTCEELPVHWPWIIVPLDIDAEICPVDASWANKTECTI